MARSRGESEILRLVKGAPEADGDDGGGTLDERMAKKALNDIGNGERFRIRYGTANFMLVPEIGWFAWVKTHWSLRDGDRLLGLALQKTAVKINAEAAAAAGNPDLFDARQVAGLRGWANESGNSARLAGMLSAARPHLMHYPDELDGDPLLVNCQNGSLELGAEASDTGGVAVRLRRHQRRDLCTRILPVGWDEAAECPRFEAFLAEVLPDPEVRQWVQKLFGYALSGATSEHMMAAFWGDGQNGKSTLCKLFRWLYGDYATTIEFATILTDGGPKRGSDASPDLAKLPGVRAVFAAEPRKGARIDDGRIKSLTSYDEFPVRKLNKEFFDLQPVFKLILNFNNKPVVRDDTHGMWRRVRLVPFGVIIPEERADKGLLDKLKGEGPGVLNWAVAGYRAWREEGLDPPEAIRTATGDYRSESDRIGQFIAAALVRTDPFDPNVRLSASDIYACYEGWCRANEVKPMSLTLFGKELTKRNIPAEKRGTVARLGVRWSGECDWEWAQGFGSM